MDRLGIEALSVFGLPPAEFVDLAADLGCRYITIFLQTVASVPLGYPPFSLKDDVALRRDLLAAMDHRGVTISLGDGFIVLPGADMRSFPGRANYRCPIFSPRFPATS
jgi:hypothetical protein